MLKLSVLICCFINPIFCIFGSYSSAPADVLIGSNAFWDDATNSVYYIDLFGNSFNRYSYDENKVYEMAVDGISGPTILTTFIQPIEGRRNRFLVGINGEAIVINWDGRSSKATKVKDVFSMPADNNIYSVMTGPNNNIIVGGFTDDFCANKVNLPLYQYDANDKVLSSVNGEYISTIGMVLNEKTNTLYHLDACTKTIRALDFNPRNGHLSNERIVYKFTNLGTDVVPVGLAFDSFGHIYTGLYGGGAVVRINPLLGKIVDRYELPTPFIGGPTFGGPLHDILFVPTSSLSVSFYTKTTLGEVEKPGGNLFMIRGILRKGYAQRKPRIQI